MIVMDSRPVLQPTYMCYMYIRTVWILTRLHILEGVLAVWLFRRWLSGAVGRFCSEILILKREESSPATSHSP
jgi:hypothetical protein